MRFRRRLTWLLPALDLPGADTPAELLQDVQPTLDVLQGGHALLRPPLIQSVELDAGVLAPGTYANLGPPELVDYTPAGYGGLDSQVSADVVSWQHLLLALTVANLDGAAGYTMTLGARQPNGSTMDWAVLSIGAGATVNTASTVNTVGGVSGSGFAQGGLRFPLWFPPGHLPRFRVTAAGAGFQITWLMASFPAGFNLR